MAVRINIIKAAPKPANAPNKELKNIPKTTTTAIKAIIMIAISIMAARNLIQNPLKGEGWVPINRGASIIVLNSKCI